MVRVVYTHDIFSRQATGGISRYFAELIRGVATAAESHVLAGFHWNRHLADVSGAAVRGRLVSRPVGGLLGSALRTANRLWQGFLLPRGRNTVIHHTYYGFTSPAREGRLVVTVHDMIPELFAPANGSPARWAGLRLAKRLSCRRADRVIAVSNTTKCDLCERYDLPENRVDVIPHGNPLAHLTGCEFDRPHEAPYLLYVGNRSGYKNWAGLVEAIAGSATIRESLDLVCFGGGPFRPDESQLIGRSGLTARVHAAAGDDETLAAFYRHAAAYVCPSLYEGFGLPCVEAMGFGCPIVCADRGSLPEVVGPAGIYFDPDDAESIRQAIEQAAFDAAAAKRLKPLMAERERSYRWSRTVAATLRTYRHVAGEDVGGGTEEIRKAA